MGVSKDLSNYLTLFGARELITAGVESTTFNSYPFQAFIVNKDVTITNLQYSGSIIDIKADFGIGVAPNDVVYSPAYIAADQTKEFSSITFTGGSIVIVALTGSYSNPI
jgi:hypothetical protein